MKKSYLHALGAIAYIVGIVLLMQSKVLLGGEAITGIAVLTLLVLSVAIMGYLFFGMPIQLFISGEKKEAVRFFWETIIVAALALGVFVLVNILLAMIR